MQEDTIKAQEALKNQLQEVGMDVENTRGDVAEVPLIGPCLLVSSNALLYIILKSSSACRCMLTCHDWETI